MLLTAKALHHLEATTLRCIFSAIAVPGTWWILSSKPSQLVNVAFAGSCCSA